MKQEYIEKIYAGWLAKMIGIRLGAVVEGWTCERIAREYGEVKGYLQEYKNFAADDDSNGPYYLLRALPEGGHFPDLQPQDVADALMNYAGWEHGFFWFGGYGVSTEHTAFLNLWNGIPAPLSGSAQQNGLAVAEQIGGQIFIDCWGLMNPGNPERAARFARAAASVTHDGNGIWGGVFIAVCISQAFVETDIRRIIEKGLEYIPQDCEYAAVVRDICAYHEEHPQSWRDCFSHIRKNWGYDRYPGNCHIIPNAAVIILSLLYGEGDFDRTLCICNMCGWDTDCNVGNTATIMGVRGGTKAIDPEKWRAPINDLAIFSGTTGALNISDIPEGASLMAALAFRLDGEEPPALWKNIWDRGRNLWHFEYLGSTHAFCIRGSGKGHLENVRSQSASGNRALLAVMEGEGESRYEIFRKTYYEPEDFSDSRYDPSFSPVVYPGQTLRCLLSLPERAGDNAENAGEAKGANTAAEGDAGAVLCLYGKLRGKDGTACLYAEERRLAWGERAQLEWRIPAGLSETILEVGVCCRFSGGPVKLLLHEMEVTGGADYRIDFSRERTEKWTDCHREISQFTRGRGLAYLEGGQLHLTGTDWAEVYTGSPEWKDYEAQFELTPQLGEEHCVLFRVQGAARSYGFGFTGKNRIGVWKKDREVRLLKELPFAWEAGRSFCLTVRAKGEVFLLYADGKELFRITDEDRPRLSGCIGLGVRNNSHCRIDSIRLRELEQG